MIRILHNRVILFLSIFMAFAPCVISQNVDKPPSDLPVKYEEINSIQFIEAVKISGGTCIIPFGILEKHGPHLPLGTDLLNVREVALRAAKEEYTLVYPQYYFGQIYEAQQQPGTIAYSHEIIWNLLQETCAELSRNGIRKIIIVNGHGGNNNFLKYFCQAQLESKKDYAVYFFLPAKDMELEEQLKKLRKTEGDAHAGEVETSELMAHRPDLVNPADANIQSGEDLARLKDLKDSFTGIWWYAKFPNHYSGDGSPATKEIGDLVIKSQVKRLSEMIRSVKADTKVLDLQNRFFQNSEYPLKTGQ